MSRSPVGKGKIEGTMTGAAEVGSNSADEVEIVIQLPRVLANLTGCERRISVTGGTVAEALNDLIRRHPALEIHLFDDTGALRRHVLCFRNQVAIQSRTELAGPLRPGDRLTLVNSVAGG